MAFVYASLLVYFSYLYFTYLCIHIYVFVCLYLCICFWRIPEWSGSGGSVTNWINPVHTIDSESNTKCVNVSNVSLCKMNTFRPLSAVIWFQLDKSSSRICKVFGNTPKQSKYSLEELKTYMGFPTWVTLLLLINKMEKVAYSKLWKTWRALDDIWIEINLGKRRSLVENPCLVIKLVSIWLDWVVLRGFEWIWIDLSGFELIWTDLSWFEWISWKALPAVNVNGFGLFWLDEHVFRMDLNGFRLFWMDQLKSPGDETVFNVNGF